MTPNKAGTLKLRKRQLLAEAIDSPNTSRTTWTASRSSSNNKKIQASIRAAVE